MNRFWSGAVAFISCQLNTKRGRWHSQTAWKVTKRSCSLQQIKSFLERFVVWYQTKLLHCMSQTSKPMLPRPGTIAMYFSCQGYLLFIADRWLLRWVFRALRHTIIFTSGTFSRMSCCNFKVANTYAQIPLEHSCIYALSMTVHKSKGALWTSLLSLHINSDQCTHHIHFWHSASVRESMYARMARWWALKTCCLRTWHSRIAEGTAVERGLNNTDPTYSNFLSQKVEAPSSS